MKKLTNIENIVLNELKVRTVNTLQFRQMGVDYPNHVMHALRNKGYVVDTAKITIKDNNGRVRKGIAHYTIRQ